MQNREFNITSYSFLVSAFLILVWPLSIILIFTPQINNPDQPAVNLITRIYLPTVLFQILVFISILLTLKKEDSHVSSTGFDRFKYIYLAYALIFILLSSVLLMLVSTLLADSGIFDFIKARAITPESKLEIIVWIVLSAVVAIVEELAYRGYLLTRMTRLFKSKYAAVIVSTLAFAMGHFYQGLGGVILIFVYGLMFAGLFLYTRSLWPCIIAHFIHNVIAPFI